MATKEASGTKYVRGKTEETEDTDSHNVSQSFEMTARGEEIKPAITFVGKNRGRHFGASFPFFWVNGEPYFTIGPHCNSYLFWVKL